MNHQHAINHFQQIDPIIYRILQQVNFSYWFNELKPKDYFQSLVNSIIGQQLSLKAARTIRGRVEALMPDQTFTPQNILNADQDRLRAAGMAWAKIRSIRDLSERVLDKRLTLEELTSLSDQQVIETLITVKGIGVWTAEMFLIFNLARPDIYSFGDGGLRQAMKNLYRVEEYTPEAIAPILKPWSPYRSYACIALWQSLDNT